MQPCERFLALVRAPSLVQLGAPLLHSFLRRLLRRFLHSRSRTPPAACRAMPFSQSYASPLLRPQRHISPVAAFPRCSGPPLPRSPEFAWTIPAIAASPRCFPTPRWASPRPRPNSVATVRGQQSAARCLATPRALDYSPPALLHCLCLHTPATQTFDRSPSKAHDRDTQATVQGICLRRSCESVNVIDY